MLRITRALIYFALLFSPAYCHAQTSYDDVINTLLAWQKSHPNYVHVGEYGVSTNNKPLVCLKLTDKSVTKKKYKVLVIAAIHGNEMFGTSVLIEVLRNILSNLDKDYVRQLISTRELYVVPITCPETYLRERLIFGKDPNRNFLENTSLNPIECLKRLHLQLHFDSVLSCHTFGRVVMYPYGKIFNWAPNYTQLKTIAETMAQIGGYTAKQLCYCYHTPIFGTEADWFYDNGANVAMVIELGTNRIHSQNFSKQIVDEEVRRTFWSFVYFFKVSPIKDK